MGRFAAGLGGCGCPVRGRLAGAAHPGRHHDPGPSFYTIVGATFGYASAEVLVNLEVLDGSRLLRSSRLSLSRTIGAVFWLSSHGGSGVYPLSCEFDHPVGNPRSYVAWAELETWAGGGEVFLVSPAIASGTCTVERITVTLIR